MSIQEKKHEIVSLRDDLPESTLDRMLELIQIEGKRKPASEMIIEDRR